MMNRATLLLILLLAITTGCNDSNAPVQVPKSRPVPPVLVEVAQVQKRSVAKTWRRSGTLVYRHILRVHTQEEGRITSLPWFEGDSIKKGNILLTLDNKLLKAELKKAEATRSMAIRKVSRLERLRKTKAASEEDLIEAQTELELARAEVDILKTRLGYTTIKAAFSGIITHRLAEPGDVKSRNSHLLTLADPRSLIVRVAASEQLLADLKPDSRITVHLDIPGSTPIAGSIQRIFPTLDPQTRQGTIEIELDNPPDTIRAGQFVRVELAGNNKTRLLIPFTALRTDRHGEYVYVVKNGRVARKAIISGTRFDDWLEVIDGLNSEDQIVKRGFMNLKNDRFVTILN
ncbi:MAG TPA: efflux RND transporter periplasmic adaptor subunit [Thiolapillus brandeum]|uniref:Efflux RND transporter periplasmic adaptor subunit n=1 Tax=Thiolapillus brandeum TaxID=1076588 RepID=A0A831JW52_9GAMM|nr:efflux RND transporter periplasmic adaptor subunit [Thiolapillus brandeum]